MLTSLTDSCKYNHNHNYVFGLTLLWSVVVHHSVVVLQSVVVHLVIHQMRHHCHHPLHCLHPFSQKTSNFYYHDFKSYCYKPHTNSFLTAYHTSPTENRLLASMILYSMFTILVIFFYFFILFFSVFCFYVFCLCHYAVLCPWLCTDFIFQFTMLCV